MSVNEDLDTNGAAEPKVLVIIPTYNEKESLPITLGRLRAAVPEAHVLVADDGSPDGTGKIADDLAAKDSNVNVMHREAKQGLGAAYLAGFAWGLERGFDIIVEMDADGSHQPEQLPLILDEMKAQNADLVLGSRWVPGGAVVNWPTSRKLISRVGNIYVKIMLGLGLGDATGGFRAYSSRMLEELNLDSVESQGYCFQVDMARRVVDAGGTVREVPITFVERELGQSKMSGNIVREALWRTTVWGFQKRGGQIAGIFGKKK